MRLFFSLIGCDRCFPFALLGATTRPVEHFGPVGVRSTAGRFKSSGDEFVVRALDLLSEVPTAERRYTAAECSERVNKGGVEEGLCFWQCCATLKIKWFELWLEKQTGAKKQWSYPKSRRGREPVLQPSAGTWNTTGPRTYVHHIFHFHTYFHVQMEILDVKGPSPLLICPGVRFQWICFCCISFIPRTVFVKRKECGPSSAR